MDFLITIILLAYLGLLIGATDTTSAFLLGSRFLSPKKCIVVVAAVILLGSILFRENVEEVVGEKLLEISLSEIDVLTILFSSAIWISLARLLKLPISLTYITIGSSVGVGMFKNGVNFSSLAVLSIAWFILPLIALLFTIFLVKILNRAFSLRVRGLKQRIKITRISFILLFLATLLAGFSKGGNITGNIIAFAAKLYHNSDFLGWIVGIFIASGLIYLGEKVVKNVGLNLIELDPIKSLCGMFSTSIILLFSTLLGIPISETYILIASLAGIGIGKGIWVNFRSLTLLLAFLTISFLFSALTSFLIESSYYQYS